MAVVKGPALSLDASGNLGGICYSRWRGFNIARDTWTGTVPNTSAQQVYQADLTSVSQAWGGTLDADDRQAWEDYSKSQYMIDRFGEKYTPSGYNLFMSRNLIRKRWSMSILLRPYHRIKPLIATDWYVEWQVSYPRVYVRMLNGNNKGYPDKLEYWRAGPYASGGRKPIDGEWLLKKITGYGGWYNHTWTTSGDWFWYRCRMGRNDGVVSDFLVEQFQIP